MFITRPIKKVDKLGRIWLVLDNKNPLNALKRLNPQIGDIIRVFEAK